MSSATEQPLSRVGVPEVAPSQVSAEEPSLARLLGWVGFLAAGGGLIILLLNHFLGPRLLTPPYGWFMLAVGVPLVFFHALNDRDETIRRAYGFALGYGLVIAAAVLLILDWVRPAPAPEDLTARRVGLFLSYGSISLLMALGFLAVFVRNEEDDVLRRGTANLILWLGVGFSLVGLGFAVVASPMFVGVGFVVAALGLLYLATSMGLSGSLSDRAYSIGRALWALGVVALVIVVVRGSLPYFSKTQRDPYLVPGLLLGAWGLAAIALGAGATSDRRWVVLTRRELTSYFVSPIAYLVLIGFAFMGFLNYWLLFVGEVAAEGGVVEPVFRYYVNIVGGICAMFAVPAITMRTFSEEKRTGTYEVLMSAPVTETSVVASKFLAAWLFYMVCWVPWALYLLGMRVETGSSFDVRPMISFAVALGVTGAGFISMGVFFSCLTRHQIVAAALTFGGMLFFLLMLIVTRSKVLPPQVGQLFAKLNFIGVWQGAAAGLLPLRDLFVWASLAVLGFYGTVKVAEARRWS